MNDLLMVDWEREQLEPVMFSVLDYPMAGVRRVERVQVEVNRFLPTFLVPFQPHLQPLSPHPEPTQRPWLE